MYKLHFVVHSLPKSLNKSLRTHRFKAHAQNKTWDLLIYGIIRGHLPKEPLKKARIKIVRHFYRTLDYDGLVGSLKPVVDAIVDAGVLVDDSWGVLGAWEVRQEFRQKKDGPLLEIEVIEVPC